MKLAIRVVVICLTLYVSGTTFGSEIEAKAAVQQFCARLEIPISSTGMVAKKVISPKNGAVRWNVSKGEQWFTVEGRSMEVTLYMNASEEAHCRIKVNGNLTGMYRSEAIAVAKARSILQILNPGHRMIIDKFVADGENSRFPTLPRRNAVTIVMRESDGEGGRHAVGNLFEVTFNGVNGRIIALNIQRDWVYEPKVQVLSVQQAIQKAKDILEDYNPQLISQSPRVHRQYMVPMPGFGCSIAAQYQREKRARYAYCVTFQKVVLFIDAEDGKSLGGFRIVPPQ